MSVTVTEPVREPVAVGVKVTLIVHDALAARLVPQALVSEKSPLIVMLEIARLAPPELLRVTLCGLLLVPNACDANVKDIGDRLIVAAVPVPDRLAL